MANKWWIFNLNHETSKPQIILPIHHHFLEPSVFPFNCSGCSETKNDCKGYYCDECKFYFHKECADSPLEINHPSHPAHPLKLLRCEAPRISDGRCRLCGQELKLLVYHCFICNFSLDTACARKHEFPSIDHPKAHEHRLHLLAKRITFNCDACGKEGHRAPYLCRQCSFIFHKDCIFLPRAILITRHKHRISRSYFIGPGNFHCGVCRLGLDGRYGGYRCSKCPDYVVHLRCATRDHVWDGLELEDIPEEKDYIEDTRPFQVVRDKLIKHFGHEHFLTLKDDGIVSREIMHHEYCDACTESVTYAYYKCSICAFLLHERCANLPRKLRHELHEHPLTLDCGFEVFSCTECNELCGGFSYICSNVKTNCKVKFDAQCNCSTSDGLQLSVEDTKPFEVVHDKVIKHFSHEHYLKFNYGGGVCHESIHCNACALPVYFDAYYECSSCAFVLHKTCANLPRKLRHELHKHPLTLRPNTTPHGEHGYNLFNCTVCQRLCSGFKYVCCKVETDCNVEIDVRCCSIREPFIHESHTHPLFFTSPEPKVCSACNETASSVLSCVECDFNLGYDCATLPNKVKHKCDKHFLSLCYGEKTSVQYWCEVCEGKVNPNTRFYTCEDCSTTLHLSCVIGNFTFWRPGYVSISHHGVTVVPNVFATRPRCLFCRCRCEDTSGILYISQNYICSPKCLEAYFRFNLTYQKFASPFYYEISDFLSILQNITCQSLL